jgi:hypothetical protein
MLPEFFRAIGSDSCLTRAELSLVATPHARADAAWEIYRHHFRSFTGSTLDPQFHRLAHPATLTGEIHVSHDETVIVVGTGPSLARHIDTLKRVRHHVRVFTSPRGAERLLTHGITPDLVLIEHQTALDAHHSARHLGDASTNALARCPLVAADWRTPPAMIANLAPSSLFVPASLPTWGLWPATAVAMAAEAGASRLALIGIDLGTSEQPDPAHAPLLALIELLASLVPFDSLRSLRAGTLATVDCGSGGARKRGWQPVALEDIADRPTNWGLETRLIPAPRLEERSHQAAIALEQIALVIERAAQLRSVALRGRATGDVSPASLRDGMAEALAWGQDRQLRVALQESLGVAFLPRFWRIGVDLSLGSALWRPLLLATDELTAQADVLRAIATHRRAGPCGPADRPFGPADRAA